MSLLISSRRRKLLFAAAAIAAGGYASYRIYNSSAFARRRRRLLQILNTFLFCCEAVSQSAESVSILSSDLKSFLLSDDDSVPQSLNQAFKIGQSEEFQGTVTVLSAALTRGLLRGVIAKPGHNKHVRTRRPDQRVKSPFPALLVNDAGAANEDVACREIREVCFTTKRQDGPTYEEHISLSNRSDCQEWEHKSYSSGSDMQSWRTRKVGVVPDKSRRGKPPGDLVDKLFSKLFSDTGIGFASAVTSTLARNLVLAFFDEISSGKDYGSTSSANGYMNMIDVISTAPCRMLIAECIQTFITTAVTVYIDKTKDVNFYNDMVAGITNPSHRDPMKDVLSSVCNGAIETLVKTSYGVMVAENDGGNEITHIDKNQWDIQESSRLSSGQGQMPSTTEICIEEASSEGCTHDEQSGAQAFSKASVSRLEGNKPRGVQCFIDGVSKTLAIPSNRKLVMDVAGTMTSEAVRSFVDAVVRATSNHISGSWDRVKSCIVDQQGLRMQKRSRDMAVKALVLASVCLAICLHVLTGFQIQQKT